MFAIEKLGEKVLGIGLSYLNLVIDWDLGEETSNFDVDLV